jgi:hypothetical protein
MERKQFNSFLRSRLLSSSSKVSAFQYFNNKFEEAGGSDSVMQGNTEGGSEGAMPETFWSQWPILRKLLKLDATDASIEVFESLLFANFESESFAVLPLLACCPAGMTIPKAFQRDLWMAGVNSVGWNSLPPRSPEAAMFLWNCLHILQIFWAAMWHESFRSALEPIMQALNGQNPQAAKKFNAMADMFPFLLINGALAKWANHIWTKSQDVEIRPEEASQLLRTMMQAVVDSALRGEGESFPHWGTFGENGRLQNILSITSVALARRRAASSTGGGDKGLAAATSAAAARPAMASLSPPGSSAETPKVGGLSGGHASMTSTPSGAPATSSNWRGKGVCLKCILDHMSVKHDKGACTGDERFNHPTSLENVLTEDMERVIFHNLPKWARGHDDARKWISANRKPTIKKEAGKGGH